MMPKVSLIMPCYNAELFLDDMLSSVLAQTHDRVEIICVDDKSTDGTLEKLRSWQQRFAARGYEYVIVERPDNGGASAAINNGLARFTGDFVCFPDADDRLHPEYIAHMLAFLEAHQEIGFVRCAFRKERGGLADPAFHVVLNEGRDLHQENSAFERILTFRYPVVVWNMMVRAEYLRRCIPSLKIYENRHTYQEWQFLLPLCHGGEYGQLPEVLYTYVQRPKSTFNARKESDYERQSVFLSENRKTYEESYRNIQLTSEERRMCDDARDALFLGMGYEIARQYNQPTDITSHLEALQSLLRKRGIPYAPDALEPLFFPLADALLDIAVNTHRDPAEDAALSAQLAAHRENYVIYSAGLYARRYAPALMHAYGKPSVVWDRFAAGATLCGIPVAPPPFSTPAPESLPLVVVLIWDEADARQAIADLRAHGFTNVFTLRQAQCALRHRMEDEFHG